MITKTIEVRHLVEVTVDESKFTPEWMQKFRETFYDFHTLDDHLQHLAQLAARELINSRFIEGYGSPDSMGIKTKVVCMETNGCHLLTQGLLTAMPNTPERDVVKEAREFISIVADWGIYDHAKRHITSLCDEVERLRLYCDDCFKHHVLRTEYEKLLPKQEQEPNNGGY